MAIDFTLKYTKGPDGEKLPATISDEGRDFVVNFVNEGAKQTPAQIEAMVQQGHDELTAALDGVSETQAQFKPAPDDWSILELMDHVVSTQQIVVAMCQNLAEGHWPPGIGEEWQEGARQDGVTIAHFKTLAEARSASDAAHKDMLSFIRRLDGPVDAETRFRHFLFGAFNAREWTVFQRIHDINHTPQIGTIKASPGYPSK